jgi:hypothetical protein
MLSLPRLRPWLAGLALLAVGLSAQAAPVIRPASPLAHLDKYLQDDSDFVLLVNVKGIVATPLFTRSFKTDLEGLLARPEVKPLLDGSGLNPLKDIERVVVCVGKSSHGKEFKPGVAESDGPLFFFHGRFDVPKLHAKLETLARDYPAQLKVVSVDGAKLYELKSFLGPGPGYVALLDSGTALVAPRKEQALDALAKAAGKKKTKLAVKGMPALLKTLKPDLAVQAVALGEMIVNTRYESTKDAAGNQTFKRTHTTLAEAGFKELRIVVAAKDDLRGRVTLTAKSKTDAARYFKVVTDGYEMGKAELRREVGRVKQLEPVLKVMETIKYTTGAETLTFEGRADAESIRGFVMGIFSIR